MITLYLALGLAVSLVLYVFKETGSTNPPGKLVLAISLTTVFWPVVLSFVLLEDHDWIEQLDKASTKTKNIKIPKSLNALVERKLVSKYEQKKLKLPFGPTYKKWQSIQNRATNNRTVWSFKTFTSKSLGTKMVEGYALVDENKEIIDYVIIPNDRDLVSKHHAIH